mmetsp:Transcript_26377/g.38971  ORF Transcript_26377/g.38971 Transcript_26377/m.38971 type:complete len:950 (+) Transcript_26377:110-2959(+)
MATSETDRKENRRNKRGRAYTDSKRDFTPPSLDENPEFVTSPPKQRGLTTGISTLFRRPESRDTRDKSPDSRIASSHPSAGNSPPESPLPSDGNGPRSQSRLFSSNDDDSDDSYETRMSEYSKNEKNVDAKEIRRYRGFSTSIQSLFLDESVVCSSIGCFGLLLSQRTEFLLNIRNKQRGATKRLGSKSAHRYPSRIIAFALFLTIVLMVATYVVCGFGGNAYLQSFEDSDYDSSTDDAMDDKWRYENQDDFNNGDQNDDQNQNGNVDDQVNGDDYQDADDDNARTRRLINPYRARGAMIRDYQENFWIPLTKVIKNEWNRNERRTETEDDEIVQDWGRNIRLLLFLFFLLILGVIGRRRRMRTRYALARARAQEDHLYYARGSRKKLRSSEDNFEIACSHTLCGCYPVDPPVNDNEEDEIETDGKKHKHQDCVSRLFTCLMASCCGFICNCWCQVLSVCALAQEAREVRLLVPPKYQRIDFITHQPFSEYQKAVNELRRAWLGKARRKGGIMPHLAALSRLSRYLLVVFISVVCIITATLFLNPRASFSWPDLILLFSTFLQSFLVLYIVHWIFHKSDLSLDAVVKFFAAGFVIAAPTAFLIEGMLVNIILGVTYFVWSILELLGSEATMEWIVSHYNPLLIVGELVNAFIVAAITEELCKYYTFRSVEHPDLIFLTGLDRNRQATEAFDGGVKHYPYGSHQISNLNRNNSFESTSTNRSKLTEKSETQQWIDRASTEDEYFEDETDVRTHRQKAAALTTGMIGVAVGLTCAENFLYVFFLGGSSGDDSKVNIIEEWVVLLFRSLFPIHALAAAMQSVNMIRKFVECKNDENNHRIGVGRIILPAVLLHGSFDAVLLGINIYVEAAWDKYLEANQGNIEEGAEVYNSTQVNLIAWLSITLIMLIAMIWYYWQHRSQKLRLREMEQVEMASNTRSYSPAKAPTTEVELV